MEIHLSPERQAQLNDYARRRGQDPAIALDEVLASALEWERREYDEAVVSVWVMRLYELALPGSSQVLHPCR